jgi:hypothetical protein
LRKEALPFEILSIFTPLFEELKDIEEGIDFGEFIDAANRLYEVRFRSVKTVFVDPRLAFQKLDLVVVPQFEEV